MLLSFIRSVFPDEKAASVAVFRVQQTHYVYFKVGGQ